MQFTIETEREDRSGPRLYALPVRSMRVRRRLVAWTMFVALLPSLLYLGHWSVLIPLPGSDTFVAIGMPAEHDAEADGSHGKHCHGDASCTDSPPPPAASAFAVLNETVGLLGAGGLMLAAISTTWRLRAEVSLAPLTPPPRDASSPRRHRPPALAAV